MIATTAGSVSPAAVRHLVEELRIAPTAADTTLFGEAHEFRVGRNGWLYVYDVPGNTIFLFDSTGAFRRRIGRQGAGPGEFNANGGMVVLRDGRLAVWDPQNARVQFFDPDGEFLTSWNVLAGFHAQNGLRTDRTGALLWYRTVTPPREGEILGRMGLVRLRDGGAIGDSLIPPDLPVERIVYVASTETTPSSYPPSHAPLLLWDWHPDGYFVTIATNRFQLEASRPGTALRIVRDAPLVPVSDAERSWDKERITWSMVRAQPGWTWQGPPIPSEKPPVSNLSATRDGRIWVRVAMPSEEIPEADRAPQTPDAYPVSRFREPVENEVFGGEGSFLGRVRFPPGATVMQADGDLVWLITRDADDLPVVVRARIEPAFRSQGGGSRAIQVQKP